MRVRQSCWPSHRDGNARRLERHEKTASGIWKPLLLDIRLPRLHRPNTVFGALYYKRLLVYASEPVCIFQTLQKGRHCDAFKRESRIPRIRLRPRSKSGTIQHQMSARSRSAMCCSSGTAVELVQWNCTVGKHRQDLQFPAQSTHPLPQGADQHIFTSLEPGNV